MKAVVGEEALSSEDLVLHLPQLGFCFIINTVSKKLTHFLVNKTAVSGVPRQI